ncbi:MAG: nitrous oxide-stimulated promoter family protein [Firmicutes bacterium]|nr:nitrous oxide-stimulated promoter family protein [Bacillota bacterium]
MPVFEPRVRHDIGILAKFVEIYCRKNHSKEDKIPFYYKGRGSEELDLPKMLLCERCFKLLNHGIAKRAMCPMDPKPMCKKCPNQCYHPFYKEQIREVMKFSGIYLVKRGRLDMLYHYLA